MLTIRSRHIHLSEVDQGHFLQLYEWRIQSDFIGRCTLRGMVTFDEFCREIATDRMTDRHEQLIIETPRSGRSIGTIYAYGGSPATQDVLISAYVDPRFQGRGYGVYAAVAYAQHLFMLRGVKRLHMDVYSCNTEVLNILYQIGATAESFADRVSVAEHYSREVRRFVFADEQAVKLSRFL